MLNPRHVRVPTPVFCALALFVAQTVGGSARADDELPSILLSAIFADGYAPDDGDEAVQIWNVGARSADLSGVRLADTTGTAEFPAGTRLAPGAHWWLTRDAAAFAATFGEPPDWAWGVASLDDWPAGQAARGPSPVGQLAVASAAPRLANGGERLRLVAADGRNVDVADYAATVDALGLGTASVDWHGPPVTAYRLAGVSASAQVLYRKLDPLLGLPVSDTNRAEDWASDASDALLGQRVRLPGWDLEGHVLPMRIPVRPARSDEDGPTLADGAIEVAVAPDALLGFLLRHLTTARSSIHLAAYTFDNADVADLIASRARAGVRVRVMVDGSPVGGHSAAQRWCLARIAAAGGSVLFMDNGGDARRRYRSYHAKLIVIDHRVVLIGTENPGLGAAPTAGRPGHRGAFVATAEPDAVAWAADLLARDSDAARHTDVRPFQANDPARGAPAADYTPPRPADVPGTIAPVAPDPILLSDVTALTLLSAPENVLHPTAGLLALVDRAGPGDTVRIAQLREPWAWGDGASTRAETTSASIAGIAGIAVDTDGVDAELPDGPPTNPRVAAFLAAARRGARVRVLLDGRYDAAASPAGNWATAARLNAAARAEHLDLEARLADPAGGGLHAKLVLVEIAAGRDVAASSAMHWVHLGSWNGTEVSAKANREAVVQFESAAGHAFLARVYDGDWAGAVGMRLSLPLLTR